MSDHTYKSISKMKNVSQSFALGTGMTGYCMEMYLCMSKHADQTVTMKQHKQNVAQCENKYFEQFSKNIKRSDLTVSKEWREFMWWNLLKYHTAE